MTQPVRMTIIFGGVSGLVCYAVSSLIPGFFAEAVPVRFLVALNYILYSLMLCRCFDRSFMAVLLPLVLLMILAVWPMSSSIFLPLALLVFCWARSTVCSELSGIRQCFAEVATLGGFVLIVEWLRVSWAASTPLLLWLFFLFQAMYFYFLPWNTGRERSQQSEDEFERASLEVERLLND